MIRDVTDLQIYQDSLTLFSELVVFLKNFPYSELDLKRQCKRAAQSISANIAEGFAKKKSEKEFKRYLIIALGSSDEMMSHMRILKISVPNLGIKATEFESKYKTLSRRINKMISVWHS